MKRSTYLMLATMLLTLHASSTLAAEEDANARVKEMLRRTQEALRQAQSDNADLTRAKTDAEQKLQAATKQADNDRSGSKSALAKLQAQLLEAQGNLDSLQKKSAADDARISDLDGKLADTSKQLIARNAEATAIQQSLDHSKSDGAMCEAKNVALYGYATDALQMYRHKGVWAALAQKDPVLGLHDVDVQNVVQEYQIKINAQRIKP